MQKILIQSHVIFTSAVVDLICSPPTVVMANWGMGVGVMRFRRKMDATGMLRVTI